MKGDDIADRLLNFAKRVLVLCRRFPDDFAGKYVARQLVRCFSSGGSNSEEARGAESAADFIHEMAVARKVANKRTTKRRNRKLRTEWFSDRL